METDEKFTYTFGFTGTESQARRLHQVMEQEGYGPLSMKKEESRQEDGKVQESHIVYDVKPTSRPPTNPPKPPKKNTGETKGN